MKVQDRDPPEYHLSVLNQQIRELMNSVLRRHDLKLVEWRALQCLAEEGALSVCDLSARVVIERTATGRLIDRLEARGFVEKKQMQNDRRFSLVSLLPEGRDKIEDCTDSVDGARRQLFAGLGQSDIRRFLETLHKLQRNAASPVFVNSGKTSIEASPQADEMSLRRAVGLRPLFGSAARPA